MASMTVPERACSEGMLVGHQETTCVLSGEGAVLSDAEKMVRRWQSLPRCAIDTFIIGGSDASGHSHTSLYFVLMPRGGENVEKDRCGDIVVVKVPRHRWLTMADVVVICHTAAPSVHGSGGQNSFERLLHGPIGP